MQEGPDDLRGPFPSLEVCESLADCQVLLVCVGEQTPSLLLIIADFAAPG